MGWNQYGGNVNGTFASITTSKEAGWLVNPDTGEIRGYNSTSAGFDAGMPTLIGVGAGITSTTYYDATKLSEIEGQGKVVTFNMLFISYGYVYSKVSSDPDNHEFKKIGTTWGIQPGISETPGIPFPASFMSKLLPHVNTSYTQTTTYPVFPGMAAPGSFPAPQFISDSSGQANVYQLTQGDKDAIGYVDALLDKGLPVSTVPHIDPAAFATAAYFTPIIGPNDTVIGQAFYDVDIKLIRDEYSGPEGVVPYIQLPDGTQITKTDFGYSVWSAGATTLFGNDQAPYNGVLQTQNGPNQVRTLYQQGVPIAHSTQSPDGAVTYDTQQLDGKTLSIIPDAGGVKVVQTDGSANKEAYYSVDGTVSLTVRGQADDGYTITTKPDGSLTKAAVAADGSTTFVSYDATTGRTVASSGKMVSLPDGTKVDLPLEQTIHDASGALVSSYTGTIVGGASVPKSQFDRFSDGSTLGREYDDSGNLVREQSSGSDGKGTSQSSIYDYVAHTFSTIKVDNTTTAPLAAAVFQTDGVLGADGKPGRATSSSIYDAPGTLLDQTNFSDLGVPVTKLHLDPVTMARTTTTFDGLGQTLSSIVLGQDGSRLLTTFVSGKPDAATLTRLDGTKVTYHYTNGNIDHQVDYAADGTVLHDTTFPQMGGSGGSPGGIPGTQVPSGNTGMPTVTYDPATGLTTTVTDGPSPDGKGTLHTVTVSKAFGNGTSQTVSVVATDGTGKVIHSETYYDTGKLQHTHSLNAFDGSTSDTDFDALGAITHGVTTAADGSRQVFDYSGGTVVEIRGYDAQGNLVSDVHPGQPSTGTGSTGSTGTGGGSTTYNPGSGMPTGSGGSSGSPTFSSSYDPATGLTTTTSDMADPNGTGTLHTVTVLKQAAAGSQGGLAMQTVSVLTTDASGHVVHSEAYSDAGLLQHVHNVDTRTHFVTDTTYDGSGHILHTENTSPDGSRQVSDYTGGLMTSGQTYNAAGALTSTYADGHYTYTDAFYANSGGMPTGGSTGGGTGGTSTMPSGGGSGSTGTTMPPSGSYDPNAITTRDTSDPSTGDSTHLVFKGGMPSEMVRTYADGAHYDFHVGIVPAGSGMTRLDVTDLFSHDDLSMLFGHEATRLDALDGTKDGVIHVGGDLQVAASAPDLFGAIEHQVQAQLATQPAGMDAATLQSMHDAMTAGYVGQATDMLHHVVMNGFSTLPDLHA